MTGPEHYRHAESWLFKAEHPDARGGEETSESCAAIAQVHATLALAAATALAVAHEMPIADHDGWHAAVSAAGPVYRETQS